MFPPAAKKELFRAAIGPCVGCPFVSDDLVAAAVKEPPSLVVLDAHTGAKLWEKSLPSPPQTGCVLTGGRVWVGLAEGHPGRERLGRSPGRFDCLRSSRHVRRSSISERIACVTKGGEILLLRPERWPGDRPHQGRGRGLSARAGGIVASLPVARSHQEIRFCVRQVPAVGKAGGVLAGPNHQPHDPG